MQNTQNFKSSSIHQETPSQKIGIVGAGPVGSLLSVFLAQLGISTDLYERRPDIRRSTISAGRSINMAVSTRGLYALRQIGLEEEILKQAIPMRGRMIHSTTGQLTFQPYGMNDSECIHSISRGGLNKSLMEFAEKTGKAHFHFQKRATGIRLETGDLGILEMEDELTGQSELLKYKTVIAADGSASALRTSLLAQSASTCTQESLTYGYKELHIPPAPNAKTAQPGAHSLFQMERNALHIWPRGTFMLIALPNFDGSFTCTLFLPFKGPLSFEELTSPERLSAFFQKYFPDALPLIENFEDTFFSNPTGSMVTVKCAPWNFSDKLLLIGDAAHAIVPFFGQGMNCGFEDCTLLGAILKRNFSQNQGFPHLEAAFAEFSSTRKPHSDRIADMANENFLEMRDKVGNARFLLEKEVEKKLQSKFPGEYISRYALVTFSRIPYQVAYQAGVVENEILAELCQELKHPEEIDFDKAALLIRSKLKPILSQYKGESYGL